MSGPFFTAIVHLPCASSSHQALVYYTFGALGGNLVAHMVLVSRFVSGTIFNPVYFLTFIQKKRFPPIVYLGIQILGRCGCSPELRVGTDALQTRCESRWAFKKKQIFKLMK